MILAVDAGNSRVKWATHDGRAFVHEGRVANAELASLASQWAGIPAPSAIVIANVAGDAVGKELAALAQRWPIAPRWAASSQSQCGVINGYRDPTQLGVDRWAALIGARSLSTRACVVVNAGTAMTVDALGASGEFLGGFIAPGFDLMRESLAANTALLTSERGEFAFFPRTTRDAIATGSVQSLCGAVERMHSALLDDGQEDADIVISGGTGELLARHLGRPAKFVEKLVLLGLVQIGREKP